MRGGTDKAYRNTDGKARKKKTTRKIKISVGSKILRWILES
jgi:hypothetical protein